MKKLEAVRATMVASGMSRKVVNSRVNRIRRAWRWAAQEMIPPSVVVELGMLEPLKKNWTTVPESRGVGPIAEERVRDTLPHMPEAVAAMVEVQLLTGCRVNEAVAMKGKDVDLSATPWEYRPGHHKTDHHDDLRGQMIPIGPRAAKVLEPYLDRSPDFYLFDPREAAGRKTVHRRYDRRSYAQAIYRACDRAFPHPEIAAIRLKDRTPAQKKELKAWRKRHRWSPLQLRHTAATRIRKLYGLEASQAVLGHAKADVTQIYAERLDGTAREVARAIG